MGDLARLLLALEQLGESEASGAVSKLGRGHDTGRVGAWAGVWPGKGDERGLGASGAQTAAAGHEHGIAAGSPVPAAVASIDLTSPHDDHGLRARNDEGVGRGREGDGEERVG